MGATSPRTVVVDDSRFMRGLITDILADGGVEVVGQAADGDEAVSVVAETRPDVVTMDVEMPTMNGVEAVEAIMRECPTPVLMLSAYTEDGADVTFEALEHGAVDFFAKPGGEISTGVTRLRDQLVAKVRSVATADVSRAARTPVSGSTPNRTGDVETFVDHPTLVIGSSTGGPSAVERVLAGLPRAADFRVLVVQHMPDAFTGRFADRLDKKCEYRVREATDGTRIGGGDVLVANGGTNMLVSNATDRRLRVRLTEETYDHNVQPCIDVTMQSAAEVVDGPLTGVVLTGMGNDGAAGIQSISEAGGRTLAESERTSVIFGMPRRAIETGHVDTVSDIDEMASSILDTIRAGGQASRPQRRAH